jgi:membrane protein implicated in regulation of membrane protease activity
VTNYDESTQRPGRRAIALDAVLLGVALGFLIWLMASLPVRPQWYDWLGVTAWAILSVLELISLVKVIRRRWAKEPVRKVTGYLDREGDRWEVLPEAYLTIEGIGTFPLEYVEREFGPLTPIHP